MKYRCAEPQDLDQIIDFANMVFSMLRVPHNFEIMLPKVYGYPHRKADIHVIAEENGHLCGCLGMLVYPMRIAGESIRIGYLGTMSVHPRARGKGTMGALMEKQIERGIEMGLDMIVLGGQRQRYARHGFETCGANYNYSISKANIRHAYADIDASGISFRMMTNSDASYAFSLYDRQVVSGAREIDSIVDVLKSYGRSGWIAERNGIPIGYLCASADMQTITEITLEDMDLLPNTIKAWSENNGGRLLHIQTAPYLVQLNTYLASICENYSLTPNCMIRVLNPAKIIKAYMSLKNTYIRLQTGTCIVSWEGKGTFRISVGSMGEVNVDMCDEQADMILTDRQAHQLMFDYNPYTSLRIERMQPDNWFPLPFHIPEPDSF